MYSQYCDWHKADKNLQEDTFSSSKIFLSINSIFVFVLFKNIYVIR